MKTGPTNFSPIISCGLIFFGLIGLFILCGVIASITEREDYEDYVSSSTHLVTEETLDQTPTKTIEPIKLQGTGDFITEDIQLEKGISIFTFKNTGKSNFIIYLLDAETGDTVDLVMNDIGTYEGSSATAIRKTGSYVLEIKTDGIWEGEITQPRTNTSVKVPIIKDGTSDTVFSIFLDKGLHKVNTKYEGEGNYIVYALNSSGNVVDLVFNDIGTYEGSQAIQALQSGTYYIKIQAEGSWTISIN